MNPVVLSPTTLMRSPALEFIDIAQKAGYDGIGMRLYPSPNMHFIPVLGDSNLEREVKKAVADSGLPVHDIFTFYLQPEMDFAAMERAMEYGASLGAPHALVIGDDPDWNRMVDNFGRLCDVAKQFQLTCAFDAPVNIRVLNKVELILKLIKDSGRENAAICLDPAQFYRAGEGPDLLKSADPRLMPYAMLSDATTMTPMGRYCMPGDGFVPLDEILDALPPDIPLSVHYHHSDDRYTALAWATHVLDGTRRFLRRYHEAKTKRATAK
jgi:sugar phosphate isomerase/epimerase